MTPGKPPSRKVKVFLSWSIKFEAYFSNCCRSELFSNLATIDRLAHLPIVILKDWKIELVIIDTLWGIVITGSMAYVGYKVYSLFQ